ncbi:methionine--tRNA ligase [Clostridium butyricum]|uniref:Methionine--tRNA ligase n=1 Tax=Clostridium butyricum TaxID=1492 RepID=A0A2S7F6R0_CLOBU|nr:methionine--tRNA ligase [Clostridium butyricum]KHD15146.1 methionyl-tRNA synthetase [Clostridium butyricum]MBZ0314061.1 methionine--tRNA ligase [Clostridium butyricum]PPV12527.1 methionine--tRNA ligase [Clostridium butyricum]
MNVIIGNAWPYANGELHLGRIAVLLPGDVLARYHRLMGDDVVFVSGSDSHGTPVTMKAKAEGMSPEEASLHYHEKIKECFEGLGFSFDIFTKTHTEYHSKKVSEFIKELYDKGYIYEKEVEQTYCPKCNEYLLDRYIEGKCPSCGSHAVGDQCDECSEIFESEELLEKKCIFCKSEPVIKETKHLFFALSKLENDVKRIYIRQNGWRENAQKITNRYLNEGLRDRAVTRDFNWGVDVPFEGFEDKKIYVWIEAVMGYLTASMKCLDERSEDYMEYWNGEDSRIYFVHGKDNIPFHTVIFPAILSGLGIKRPNIREISSEYMKLEGKNFSAVKNWAIWPDYLMEKYNVDLIRYYLISNGPEVKDTDFTWKSFIHANNNELVGLFGNLINRVLAFIDKNFDGNIPKGSVDKAFKDDMFKLYCDVGDNIEEGNFKKALEYIFSAIKKANKYFDDEKPWVNIKKDREKCSECMYTCIQIIANLSNLVEPFLPFAAKKIRGFLEIKNPMWMPIEIKEGKINNFNILFDRIDKNIVEEELGRLKDKKN